MPPKKKNVNTPAEPQSPEAIKAARVAAIKEKIANHFQKDAYDLAIEACAEALKIDPDNYTLYLNRSACYAKVRNFKLAAQDADEAIRLAPTNAKGYYRRGFAMENMLMLPEAMEAYKKALELDAENDQYKQSVADLQQVLDELKMDETKAEDNPDDDKFKSLVNWLRNGGARFPKLYMKYYSDDYRGVHCLARVSTNDTVLYVPLKYIITSEVAKDSDIGRRIIKANIELRSKHSYIAAYLLQERARGKSSFWEPYIRILPERYANMPIFFPEDELAWLTGSLTLHKIGDRIDSLRREYDNIRKDVPEFNKYSYEDFVWARLVVITRIFGLNIEAVKTDGLVPYADMLNHRLPRETKWSFEDSMRGFVITSLKTIPRGEQIYDSYGRKCNNRFFVNYGFALDENEDNEAVIKLQLPQTSPSFSFKLGLLGGQIKTSRREYQIPANYRDPKCREMFGFLRLVFAKDTEVLPLQAGATAIDKSEGAISKQPEFQIGRVEPVSVWNEKQVLKTIAKACEVSLKSFPDSIEHDEKLLASGTLPLYSNERNCVVQRLGEKRVLQWFIELNEKAAPLLDKSWQEIKKIANKATTGTTPYDFYVRDVVAAVVKAGK